MNKTIRNLTLAAAALVSTVAASSAQAMDINCTIKEVGIHGGGTNDARVIARCVTPVSGVEWIAVPLSDPNSNRFLDAATTAFLSGRTLWAWGGSTGFGCAGNCRLASSFVVWK